MEILKSENDKKIQELDKNISNSYTDLSQLAVDIKLEDLTLENTPTDKKTKRKSTKEKKNGTLPKPVIENNPEIPPTIAKQPPQPVVSTIKGQQQQIEIYDNDDCILTRKRKLI